MKLKRFAALTLTGAMCLGLFGCGDKETESTEYKTLAKELGYGYLAEYETVEDLGLDYINNVSTAQGKMYFCGDYFDQDTMESGTKLYERNMESGTIQEIPMPALERSDNSNEYIQMISMCGDGSGYWMITNQYTFATEIPEAEAVPAEEAEASSEETVAEEEPVENAEEVATEEEPAKEMPAEEGEAAENTAESDGSQVQLLTDEVPVEETTEEAVEAETGTEEAVPAEDTSEEQALEEAAGEDVAVDDSFVYQEPEEKYFAKKCDMSGNVLVTIDLTKAAENLDYFYCQALAQDAAGNLYLASDQNILCFGADGVQKENIASDTMYVQSMVASADGTVVVSGFQTGTGGTYLGRVENGSLVEIDASALSAVRSFNLYPGSGNTVLLSDGTLLYSMDATTGQLTKLLSWLDSDINGNNLFGVLAGEGDTVLVLLQDYQQSSGKTVYELGTLTKTPYDQIPERTTITLGAQYLDDVIQDAVIRFNRGSDKYRITLVDYSVYNTEEDYEAGAKQLEKDIISGTCPDILSLTTSNVDKFISKGALADMSALMEKDGEISMDDLLSGPMKAYMQDDKLYGMPYSFGLNTQYASAKLVGDRETWTMEEMGQIIDSLDEDTKIVSWYTQTDFLTNQVYLNLNQFVDFANATCSFDSDAFKRLMEISAKLPKSYETEDNMAISSGDEMQQLQTGDLLMTTSGVYDAYSIKYMYRLYTKENGIVRIGYPTDGGGNGAMLSVNGGLAISSKSKNQEGAWAFIKTMLSDEVQEEQWSLPVTNAAFDKVLASAMEKDYYLDENGEKVYTESTGYIGDTSYTIGELTQEQADDFRNYVNGASISGSYNTDIMEIITEDSAAYFAGDKSADEVAKLIQNRVATYLGETS